MILPGPKNALVLVLVVLAVSYASALAVRRLAEPRPDSELEIVSTVSRALWAGNKSGVEPHHLRARSNAQGAGSYVYLDASAPVPALLRSPLWLVVDGQAYRFSNTTDITPSLASIVDAQPEIWQKAGLNSKDWDKEGPLVVDR